MFSGTDDDVFIDIIGESAQVGAELRAQAFQKKIFADWLDESRQSIQKRLWTREHRQVQTLF